MTAAERATLSYSRGQMMAAIVFDIILIALGWLAVELFGNVYAGLVFVPFMLAGAVMYLIGYTMHTAAADTVTARHLSERETIVIKAGVVTTQTDDERRKLERDVLRWWSAGNPTTARATQAQWGISQQTWESLRNRAILDGLAHWADSPQGKILVWQASQAATIAATG